MNSQLSTSRNWYVLYTSPNYEKKVCENLTKKEITVFLPLQKIVRKWSDRTKMVDVPLFPNYLFVQLSEKDRFKVLDTFGVKCYITCSGRRVIVKDEEIDNIKRMLESPNIDLENNLVEGDPVRISEGPFKGMFGILYERMGQTRLCVRIESINQVLSIDLCSSSVEPIAHDHYVAINLCKKRSAVK